MNLRWKAFEKPLSARLKSFDDRARMNLRKQFCHWWRGETQRKAILEGEPDSLPKTMRAAVSSGLLLFI